MLGCRNLSWTKPFRTWNSWGSCGCLAVELCWAALQASRSGRSADMRFDDERYALSGIALRNQLRGQQGVRGRLFERTVHFVVVAVLWLCVRADFFVCCFLPGPSADPHLWRLGRSCGALCSAASARILAGGRRCLFLCVTEDFMQ